MANKNSKQQLAKRQRNEAKNAAKRAANQKKSIITAIVSLVAIILVVAILSVGISAYLDSGIRLRNRVAMKTENYTVNDAMFSYYLYENIDTELASYGAYYQYYFGLDTKISLKSQTYGEGTTWFDYFVSNTLNEMTTALLFAEDAKAKGVTLDEADMKAVDAKIDELRSFATTNGQLLEDYIEDEYGRGVKESDIRDAIELYDLAMKHYKALETEMTYEDAVLEGYYADNANNYNYVDYKCYTFADAETADQAKAATSAEEFDAIAKAYFEKQTDDNGEPLTADAVQYKLWNGNVSAHAYSDGGDIVSWAFDSTRKVGDTTVLQSGENYKAYYLTATSHRLEETKNVRHILLKTESYENKAAAYAEAESVLNEFLAGDKTESAFDTLANRKNAEGKALNEDSSSLYENIRPADMVAPFEAWCFDESRQPGDTGIVESEYGYHIMYFVGDGENAWKSDVSDALRSEAFTQILESAENTYGLDVYQKRINAIPGDLLA